MKAPIHLYSSENNAELRATAERLADNLGKPVLLHGLEALPAPDTTRRQQLRAERWELRVQLAALESLWPFYRNHPGRFAAQEAALREEEQLHRTRLAEIDALIGREPAAEGQADA